MRGVVVGGAAGRVGFSLARSLLCFPDVRLFLCGTDPALIPSLQHSNVHVDEKPITEASVRQLYGTVVARCGALRHLVSLPDGGGVTVTAGRTVAALAPDLTRTTKTVDLREYTQVVLSRTLLKALPPTADGSCLFVTSDADTPAARMSRDLALVVRKQFGQAGHRFNVREVRVLQYAALAGQAARAEQLGRVLAGWATAADAPPFAEVGAADLAGLEGEYPVPAGQPLATPPPSGPSGPRAPGPGVGATDGQLYGNTLEDWLPSADLSKCTTAQLKWVLDLKGIPYAGVVEKHELLRLAQTALSTTPRPRPEA